jgi:hypothetical protein
MSGHSPALMLNLSVANDPKRTFDAVTNQKAPDEAGAFASIEMI